MTATGVSPGEIEVEKRQSPGQSPGFVVPVGVSVSVNAAKAGLRSRFRQKVVGWSGSQRRCGSGHNRQAKGQCTNRENRPVGGSGQAFAQGDAQNVVNHINLMSNGSRKNRCP